MKAKTFFTQPALIATCLLMFSLSAALGQSRIQPSTGKIQPLPGKMFFKNGTIRNERNLHTGVFRKDSLRHTHYNKQYYVILQFDRLPDAQRRKELAAAGIRLFDYIPDHAYMAELRDSFSTGELQHYDVSGVYPLPPSFKLARRLQQEPETDLHDPNKLIAVRYFGAIDAAEVKKGLEDAGAIITPTRMRPDHVVFVRAGSSAILSKITALPYVSYVSIQPMRSLPLNYVNRATHGIDALGAPSGRNLQGDGVVVGVGDDADPYTHVDFTGRLIDRSDAPPNNHGTHTSGIVGGGGIKDPRYKGMAPHSTIISQLFSDILINAPTYVTDYGMVLTNNSYTNYDQGCVFDGEYDELATFTDDQLYHYPELLHVFASGNDGFRTCGAYPYQFATIKSGFQSSKNALMVGNISNYDYTINYASSCGPVNDGRLKPEIVAGGTGVTSTIPYNGYQGEVGTSMSSPTVAGALALLVQRYRQLHGGANPSSALLKALACNTATDMGAPGPDYTFGFGSLNARSAVEAMENTQYYTGTAVNAGSQTFTLTGIPAGLRQLKVMLYWTDYPAVPNAASALVNNLDLTVTGSDALTHLPLILNPDPAHVTDNAVEGVDNLNNIEQVVIDNPPAGSFNIIVNGTSIPTGAQDFVVVYQAIRPSVDLIYPYGNETWVPGMTEYIRWNAYGGDPNTFTIEYSADNGSTWTTIDNAVPAASRMYSWATPSVATNQGLIRVSRNSTSYSDVSHYPITILDQPVLTATNPCAGYVQLNWNAIASATGYDIMQLIGDSMVKIAGATSTSFLVPNLNRDSSYWFSVRAVNGPNPGRRAVAQNIQPSGGACTLSALDNDYTIDSLIGPISGRMYTSTQLSNTTPVKVELKNLGTIPTGSSFTMNYSINGGAPVSEPVSFSVPPNGGAYVYTFTNTADFSAAGSYTLQLWVTYPADPQTGNDTLTTVIKQLANDPITLTPAFSEGFETATAGTYTSPTLGLTGLDRADFNTNSFNGRARTFINTGFARTGNRCVTLDATHQNYPSAADSLITTFNLSGYSSSDQLWLDFYYQNQGIDFPLDGNQVWIRGNDQAAWIPAYTLDIDAAKIGIYQPSAHIDITGLLKNATPSQTVSSSFQVKFGEEGYTSTNSVVPDADFDDGYSFDDIKISRSMNDVGITTLVTPDLTTSCNLTSAETIRIKVKNYSPSVANNIQITWSVNGVAMTPETISSINGMDSIIYAFTQTADMSAYQTYTVQAWIHFPGDTYSSNDTLTPVLFMTGPVISSFPYLEGFESGAGYWHSDGLNNSWQLGTPQKSIINKAANGTSCWVTSLTGNYNDNESSYLYSPCFDLSGLTHPVLSFSHIFQTEDDCDCDYHWVEYTTDGISWIKLGAAGSGTNWYDNTARQAWQVSNAQWHVSSFDIPVTPPLFKFRIAMKSDQGVTYEGVGIDDVHIFEKAAIYSGANITSGLSQTVTGNAWLDFNMGPNRVVSINPNGQNLGNTNVQVYINTGGVRNDGTQYYLDRNIVIRPTTPPSGNVSIRYYFLDSEVGNLIAATGCPACTTIPDAYQAGVTQYSSSVPGEENGTISDNVSGSYLYHLPHQDVSIVPYDNGYYAEYTVTGFSEFWINNGGPGNNLPLPLTLLSFTATRAGEGALLQWSTAHESNISRFVIQRSSDGSHFSALDSVRALNDSNTIGNYRYTDPKLPAGVKVNYYRLKMIDIDGRTSYSPIRTVDDTGNGPVIGIYPNPVVSNGNCYISSSANCQKIQLTDVSGRVLVQMDAHGLENVLPIGPIARGIYLIVVDTEAGRVIQKVFVK